MRQGLSRGFVLRWLGSGVVSAVVLAGLSVSVPPAAAGAPGPSLVVPDSAWTPGPASRKVVGGAPPAGSPWNGASARDERRSSCASSTWGVLPDYPLERFRISDRLQFGVHLANGDLWIDHRDLTVRGTGLDMTLRTSYGYQNAWHLNAGRAMSLDLSFSGKALMPLDGGACATFPENASGGYDMALNGVRANLTKNTGGSYTVRFVDSGERWNYNPNGWLLNRSDRNGNAITYYYNSDGSLASVADSQGRVTTFTTVAGQVTKIVDPSGAVAGEYAYDDAGHLTELTDRDGETVSFGYNGDGRLTSIEDQLGRTWQLTYGSFGYVTGVTTPRQTGGPVTTSFAYDSDTQTTETDPNGNKTVYTFDDESRQISAKDALGHTQSKTWTANSDVQTTTDGLSNTTTAAYDTIGNLISAELPTGATTAVGYTSPDHPNQPTSITDPDGRELTRDYDAAGNLTVIHSVDLNADIETRSYSGPTNLLTSVRDGNNNRTGYAYDPAGNLTTITPPAPMGQTGFTYDSLSRITSVTDGNGQRIDYAYDRLDRIVAISEHGGAVLQTMDYDAVGGLIDRDHGAVSTTFSYDTYPSGRLITAATRTSPGSTETVSYTYDKTGNLKTMTDPAGTATYGYDAANRLTSLADPFSQTTTFGYDNADRRTTVTFPGAGSQTNTYDNSGRLTGLTAKNTSGTELFTTTYSYTASGGDSDLLQSKTVPGTTTTYGYDELRHLRSYVRRSDGVAAVTNYTVDKADNITLFGGTPHTVNAADQLTGYPGSTVGYDGAGNVDQITTSSQTSPWSYSSTNQLVDIKVNGAQVFQAAYDTIDQTQPRTITETTSGTTTAHVFTQTALGTSSALVNGTRTSVARDPDGLLVTQKTGATRYNLITDHQGSVVAALSTTGALAATFTYAPYGATTTTGTGAADIPFRFHGGYTLKNGLSLFGYRYYNAAWGRFTAPDPTRQERNDYAYAQADPINKSDPTGAKSISSWFEEEENTDFVAGMLFNVGMGLTGLLLPGVGWGLALAGVGLLGNVATYTEDFN